MVAVAAMAIRTEEEPTGRGHGMLVRWAYWYSGGLSTGAGEWTEQQRVGPGRDIAPPDESACVDKIVAQLGKDYPQYRRMLRRYYLDNQAYWEIAARLQYTIGFVRLSIQAAADLVARRYDELNP